MAHIAIIAASVRTGRKSDRVALFFKQYIEQNNLATVEIVDLNDYRFPIFDERLRFMPNPTDKVLDFTAKITGADGVLIVTPEYNGGYPAALKNVLDLLYAEWYRKPIAISTVSSTPFGGSQVITSLQFTLWKMRAWTVPAMFPVAKVESAYNEDGTPVDPAVSNKFAKTFIDELLWCIEAKQKMEAK